MTPLGFGGTSKVWGCFWALFFSMLSKTSFSSQKYFSIFWPFSCLKLPICIFVTEYKRNNKPSFLYFFVFFLSVQFLLYLSFEIFFSGLVCRLFFVQWKYFRLKCLNYFLPQQLWRKKVSKCIIIIEYCCKFFNIGNFWEIIL